MDVIYYQLSVLGAATTRCCYSMRLSHTYPVAVWLWVSWTDCYCSTVNHCAILRHNTVTHLMLTRFGRPGKAVSMAVASSCFLWPHWMTLKGIVVAFLVALDIRKWMLAIIACTNTWTWRQWSNKNYTCTASNNKYIVIYACCVCMKQQHGLIAMMVITHNCFF